MRALVGVGNPARQLLRMLLALAEEGKHRRRIVARLFSHLREVDAAAVDPRWCARLQPADRQIQFAQACRKADRRRIAGTTALIVLQPDMNQARKKTSLR